MAPLADSLDRIASLLGPMEGDPTPLAGGITNRNFRARFGGRDVVVRLPGKDTEQLGIDREAERAANACAARAGVAPEVAASLTDPPCLVTFFVEGREMSAAELRRPSTLETVAVALRAVHGCEPVATSFSPFRVVEDYAAKVTLRGAAVPAAYERCHATATRVETALRESRDDAVLCHNDLLAANFLHSPEGLRIVDWEYAGMGDRYFDLGNFAVNNELGADEETALLGAYFGAVATAGQLAVLGLMRYMSDFREAMWAVLQGTLSDLDFDFTAYADKHFARLAAAEADRRFAVWIEEASGATG